MKKYAGARKANKSGKHCSQLHYRLLVLLVPMIVFLLGAGGITSQAHTQSGHYQAMSDEDIHAGEVYQVGDVFRLGNLRYSVNKVTTLEGQDGLFNSPKKGNAFLLIEVSIENQGKSDVEIRSKLGFKLNDRAGKRQHATVGAMSVAKDLVNGTVKAGDIMTGELGFEVAKDARKFDLLVISDPLSANSDNARVLIDLPDEERDGNKIS